MTQLSVASHQPTRLISAPDLARRADVARVFLKLEADRPLGSFKVLGGLAAGLRALARAAGVSVNELPAIRPPSLPGLVCASDGNHGLAVVAAARQAGTQAHVFLPEGVNHVRAARIKALGGNIICIRGTYDDAVIAAQQAAAHGAGLLIPDTSSDPDHPIVHDVLAGYAVLPQELAAQFRDGRQPHPSHLFIQAGVGGLAAAMARGCSQWLLEPRRLIVVEPQTAACVAAALAAGHPVQVDGDLQTSAEMLSCGIAAAAALRILQEHSVASLVIDEGALQAGVDVLQTAGVATTASGAAGFAGLLYASAHGNLRQVYGLTAHSTVLAVITEGPN